ncbi:MAG: hypothetical protein WCC92_20960 [Candidatus Korobacteraceae bacterium]
MTSPAQDSAFVMGTSLWRAAFVLAIVCSLASLQMQSAQAQTFTVLHTFEVTDGLYPYAGLTMDAHGNLYGVTAYGGNLSCDGGGPAGCGVVFELRKANSNWIFSLLYIFPGNDGGFLPTYPSQITLGPNGTPYGAELEGAMKSRAQSTISCHHRLPQLP